MSYTPDRCPKMFETIAVMMEKDWPVLSLVTCSIGKSMRKRVECRAKGPQWVRLFGDVFCPKLWLFFDETLHQS